MLITRSATTLLIVVVLAAVVVAVPVLALVAEGDKAPSFTLKGLDGKTIKLSDYAGKPTMIVFWTSWCSHCQNEAPMLQKVYADMKGKGVNVVGVSVDEDIDDAREFVKEYKMTFPNAFAGTDEGMAVVERYGVEGVPTIYVLDKTGKVVTRHVGVMTTEEMKKELAKAGVK